jgi:hypothetical protein
MSYTTDVLTGKSMVISGVSTAVAIEMALIDHTEPSFASNDSGGADRAPGNTDFMGTIRGFGNTMPAVTNPLFPNQTFTLDFTTDGGTSVSVANTMVYGLDIWVPTYDPKEENWVEYRVHFCCGGTWPTFSVGSAPTDASNPTKYSVKGLGCAVAGTTIPYVRSQLLSIRSMAESSVNSSLNGIYARPLGNIDWTFRYTRELNSINQLGTLDTLGTIVMNCGNSQNWTLNYGRLIDIKHNVERGQRTPQTAQITYGKAINGTSVGSIIDPSSTQRWP